MTDDILKPIREEILKEDKEGLPWSPKNLKQTWETYAGISTALVGMYAGFTFGSHIGIALGPWGAIARTVPCAIIGGVVGYLTGAKVGSKVERGPRFSLNAGVKSSTATLVGGEREALTESDVCLNCGTPKSVWWDTANGYCGKCRAK